MAGETFTMAAASAPGGVHALTFAKLQDAVKHALGKTTLDSTTNLSDIVNDALVLFYGLHPWSWRETALSVSTTIAQQHVALPDDFGELVTDLHLGTANNPLTDLVKSNLSDIVALRTSTLSGIAAAIRYAVTYAGGDEDNELPTARLELWPTPTSVYPINGIYRRMIRKLTDDGDVPDVPAQFHQLLKRVVRAHALDEDDQADAAERAWAHVNAMLPAEKEKDGRSDDNLGRMRGATSGGPTTNWNPTITLE